MSTAELIRALNEVGDERAVQSAFECALREHAEWLEPQAAALERLAKASCWQQIQVWKNDSEARTQGLSFARILTLLRLQVPRLRFPLHEVRDWGYCFGLCEYHTAYADSWYTTLTQQLPLHLSAAALIDTMLQQHSSLEKSVLSHNERWHSHIAYPLHAPPQLNNMRQGYNSTQLAEICAQADSINQNLAKQKRYKAEGYFLCVLPLQTPDYQQHLQSHQMVGWSAYGNNQRPTDERDKIYRCQYNTEIIHNAWQAELAALPLCLGMESVATDLAAISLHENPLAPHLRYGVYNGKSLQLYAYERPASSSVLADW